MCTNCHPQPIEPKSQDSQAEDELDNIILELVHAGSRLPAGKTINAGMFPEAKASLSRLVLRERKDELKEIQLAPMSNPSTLNDDSELEQLVRSRLRSYADAGSYVEDQNVKEILQAVHQRDEARDNEIAILKADIAYAIGRFQGMEMDSAYLEQRYPEWKQLTNTEKG